MKRTWAKNLLKKDWGIKVCVPVWLRKQNGPDYEPTKADYKDAQSNYKHIQSSLTAEDIIRAFDNGEEVRHCACLSVSHELGISTHVLLIHRSLEPIG